MLDLLRCPRYNAPSLTTPKTIMKRIYSTLSALFVAFGALAATAQAELKVASVNMTELNIMFYKRVEVEASLKKQEAAIQEEINTRQNKLRDLVEEAKKVQGQMDPTLSDAAAKKIREQLASLQNEITADQEELKTFVQRRQVAFRELVRRELTLLANDLHAAVSSVASEGGYDIVVDSSAMSAQPGGRVLPYVKPDLDISPAVLKKLNEGAPEGYDPQAELQRVRGAAQAPAPAAAE